MNQLDKLFAANQSYASEFSSPNLPSRPSRHVAILTCMDTRIDPLAIFQADLGEIHVIRNAGGRVTDDAIRSLIVSEQMLGTHEILVMQHTECGMMSVNDSDIRKQVGNSLGMAAATLASEVDFLTFCNLDENLRRDVEKLRECPLISATANIRGAIYDVKTGRVFSTVPETCETH